jgi:hypothetical protein
MKTWFIRLIIFLLFQASVHVIGPIPEINTSNLQWDYSNIPFSLNIAFIP